MSLWEALMEDMLWLDCFVSLCHPHDNEESPQGAPQ